MNLGGFIMPFSIREKERIKNILGYIVQKSKDVRYAKLFKMLFDLDRNSYIQRGVPVTGYTYYAKKNGPVPLHLELELKRKPVPASLGRDESVDALSVIRLERAKTDKAGPDEQFFELTHRKDWQFNKDVLSPVEFELLEQTISRGGNETGTAWIGYGHQEWPSWVQTYRGGDGKGNPINMDIELVASRFSDEDKNNMAIVRRIVEEVFLQRQ